MLKKYSIGEVARSLQVTPRAIRYYDAKKIVKPDFIGKNGYRYYSDEQIQKLKLVIYLRQLNFSTSQIRELLNDQSSPQSLQVLLQKQIMENEETISSLKQQQQQLRQLAKITSTQKIKLNGRIDIEQIVKGEKRLAKLRKGMWLSCLGILLVELIGITSAYQFKKLDCRAALVVSIIVTLALIFSLTSALTKYYYRQVKYVCPNCGTQFVPSMVQFVLAPHTPKLRKLECPHCHQKSYCLEIAR